MAARNRILFRQAVLAALTAIDARSMALRAAIIAVTTIAAFWGIWNCGLVNLDDPAYVSENGHVLTGLSWDNISWAATSPTGGFWLPLTLISLQLDASLFRGSEGGYHVTNLILHLLNALLLMWLWQRMTGGRWCSVIVALLFAVHPLHVESVAWVSERKDVLSTFFGLLTLIGYVRYAEAPSVARYLIVAVCFVLSLLAKPMLVTLPCLLLVLDVWPLARNRRSETRGTARVWLLLVAEKLPLLAFAAIVSAVTFFFQSAAGAVAPLSADPPVNRLRNALHGYQFYLTKTIWPVDLAVFYPRLTAMVRPLELVAPAALLATLTAFAFCQRRRRPYLLTGWLWFVGTLIPVIGLVQAGDQAFADRFTYFPLIGLFAAFGVALDEFERRRPRASVVATALVCLAIAVLATKTHRQVAYWHDSESLWQHTLDVTEDNYMAHALLANVLFEQGRTDEFALHCREMLRIFPSWMGHMRFANGLAMSNRDEEAIEQYRAAIQLNPTNPESRLAVGVLLCKVQRFDDARHELEQAVSYRPGWAEAWNQFGEALALSGDRRQAVQCHAEAVRLEPSSARYRVNLASALEALGEISSAREQYRIALQLDPEWADRAVQAAWRMSTSADPKQRNGDMAVRMAHQACQALNTPPALYLDTLAAAYAELGDFERAESEAAHAIESARLSGEESLAIEIKRRLDYYRHEAPYRNGE